MKIRNPLVRALYDSARPPGHPVHLDHIIAGKWSSMDHDTIRYHLRLYRDRLSKEHAATLNQIVKQRACTSQEEIEAVKALKETIDLRSAHFAPGHANYLLFLAPLLAGVLAIILLATFAISQGVTGDLSRSQAVEMRTDLLDLRSQLYESQAMVARLKDEVQLLRKSVGSASPLSASQLRTELRGMVRSEISSSIAEGQSAGSNQGQVTLLAGTIKDNAAQLAKLAKAQQAIEQRAKNFEQAERRLQNLELLMNENPDTIVNLRLLQRDVADLEKQVAGKADAEVLKEKELRLAESINKDVLGLSRELDILRWVIYLLVIGLTASGGVIVAMQRLKQ